LDTVRFRHHPCFRIPSDPPPHSDGSVQVWAVGNGKLLITAASGIAFLEIFVEGDNDERGGKKECCTSYIDYNNDDAMKTSLSRQIALTESDIRQNLPEQDKDKKVKLEIHSAGQGKHTVADVGLLLSKSSTIKMPNGQMGYRGSKLGASEMDSSKPEELILWSSFQQKKLLTSIKVYHGFALDGIEFCYEDSTSQMFGKRGGKPGGSEFVFGELKHFLPSYRVTNLSIVDTRKSEMLLGFNVRAGLWIDGIQILTSLGRRSDMFGNATGGSR
jgi:hypothetical protein